MYNESKLSFLLNSVLKPLQSELVRDQKRIRGNMPLRQIIFVFKFVFNTYQ